MRWQVEVLPGLEAFVKSLDRTHLGYLEDMVRLLARDPCDERFYRLSGGLNGFVCGGHLPDSWRIAYTLVPPGQEERGRVIILYVDRYLRRRPDPWNTLFDIFGLVNPPAGHLKPPCCGEPFEIPDEVSLDDFERLVSDVLLLRHRR